MFIDTGGPNATIPTTEIPYYSLDGLPVMELSRVKDSNSNPIAIPGGQVVGDIIAQTVYVSVNRLLHNEIHCWLHHG